AEGRQVGQLSFDKLDAPHPYVMILPQAETERILIDRLAKLGVEVERPKELIEIEQNADTVSVRLRHTDGLTEAAAFSYLIAADGGRSSLRKLLNLSFEGSKTEGAYVADARVDWQGPPPDSAHGHMYLGRDRMLIFGLLPSGLWRIGVTLKASDPLMNSEKPTLERLQSLIDQQGGIPAQLREVTWSSAFTISYRKIEQLRHGRVFFAGDAAHIHSPAGGQGMNTGIQDAFNLAWKIGLHAKGCGGEELLDSYHAERYPIIKKLLPLIEQSEDIIVVKHSLAAQLRNRLLPIVSSLSFVQALGSHALGGFLIHYRQSPIVAERRASPLAHLKTWRQGKLPTDLRGELAFARAPRAGDRAPDAAGVLQNGVSQRLFEIFRSETQHQLLLFPAKANVGAKTADLWQTIANIEREFGGLIRPWVVTTEPSAAASDPIVLFDSTGELSRRYGARSSCLYLIRPDGYIGFRSQPIDIEALTAFWQQKLGQQTLGRKAVCV
ncbi:MAG: FAD-dependent monooxygenase, partial [Cyanobacteria bacterium Co-bin13]|nr:FAD-dependent monooxygenase [Cyanobacteria bacterium Co-bin13]